MKTLFLSLSVLVVSLSASAETAHIFKCQNIDNFYVAISTEDGNNTAIAADVLCRKFGSHEDLSTSAAHSLNSVSITTENFKSIENDNAFLANKYFEGMAMKAERKATSRAQSIYKSRRANRRRSILDRDCWRSDISSFNDTTASDRRRNCF